MNAAEGCLYPCHSIVVQFYVRHDALENKYYVSQLMMQRSMDVVLGCPFNIASSALLSVLLCHHLNHMVKEKRYIPDMLHMMIGDHHIYDAHYGVAKEQIARIPYKFPEISVKTQRNRLEDYVYEDIEITDYCHHPALKASMIA
jgi:thymidylate synthase